jgi:hypothetical protein
MFFELPCGAFKAKAENPKLAKVTVDGETMTIPELIEQLKKIVLLRSLIGKCSILKIIYTKSNSQVSRKFRD